MSQVLCSEKGHRPLPCCCWFSRLLACIHDISISPSVLFKTLFGGGVKGLPDHSSFSISSFSPWRSLPPDLDSAQAHSVQLSLALGALACLAQQKPQCRVCSRLWVKWAAGISVPSVTNTLCPSFGYNGWSSSAHIAASCLYHTWTDSGLLVLLQVHMLDGVSYRLFSYHSPAVLDLQTKPSSRTAGLRDSPPCWLLSVYQF